MSDLISRQAAIDAILKINDYNNSDRANALGLAEFAITTLPSAQPEEMCMATGRQAEALMDLHHCCASAASVDLLEKSLTSTAVSADQSWMRCEGMTFVAFLFGMMFGVIIGICVIAFFMGIEGEEDE